MTKFIRFTANTVRHFCRAFIQKDDEGNQQGKLVTTYFPEERCPYCKEKP